MADEPEVPETPEPPAAPAAPAIDPEVLGSQIARAAQAAVRDAIAQSQQAPPPVDALEEIVAPIVSKHAGRAALVAQLAADKADFYAIEDAEDLALRLHFKDEIEKTSLALASNGRALPRVDIFKHLKGDQETKVAEFRQKRRKARDDRAQTEAGDYGSGGGGSHEPGMPKFVTKDTAYELQGSGKLDEFLGGKEF